MAHDPSPQRGDRESTDAAGNQRRDQPSEEIAFAKWTALAELCDGEEAELHHGREQHEAKPVSTIRKRGRHQAYAAAALGAAGEEPAGDKKRCQRTGR
jgi:hypothetical protein